MMAISTMTSKGQLTVPKAIREYLSLSVGDKIEFFIDDNGQVLLAPKSLDVDDIVGIAKTDKKATVSDMNAAIARKISQRHKSK